MFANLLIKIREHRGLAIIIFALALLVFVFISDLRRVRNNRLQTPITESVNDKSPGEPAVYVDLVTANPNGIVNSLRGHDEITFEFTHEVDPETVVTRIRPYLQTQTFVSDIEGEKHIVKIMPFKEPWKQNTEYIVDIVRLKSVEGYPLRERARVTYKNIPPDTTKMYFPY
jgi:hypothetical protein